MLAYGETQMKVTTWAIVALVLAAGALTAVQPAQGCSEAHPAAAHAQNPPKAAPVPTGHRSFIIAARMGWL
jgi:hypothetical protein